MTTRYCVFYKIDTRRIFLHTIGILFFVISAVIPAQALHPLVRNFTRSEYKAGTQNWDITQDKNLELFFANNEGLLSFDGSSWHTTPIGNHTNVRAVLYDSISIVSTQELLTNWVTMYTTQNLNNLPTIHS